MTRKPQKPESASRQAANVRLVAAGILQQVLEGKSLTPLLAKHLQSIAERDQGFLQQLCFGACRFHFSLSATRDACLDKAIRKKDTLLACLINIGIYQLQHLRVPVHAAIYETVQACKESASHRGYKLVNAVLQRAARQDFETPCSDLYTFDHPDWMMAKLRHNWPQHWQTILSANNLPGPLCLRVNAKKVSRQHYQQKLTEKQISSRVSAYSSRGLIIEQAIDVSALPGFSEGLASVQDEAAQLCCDLLDLRKGMRVLDACAAPGGKTGAILESAEVALTALDNKAERLASVEQNLQRLDLRAELKLADAAVLEQWWDGQAFERILLDAPCSGSGVIRRHPDIKLLRQASDINPLAQNQLRLLTALWQALQPGGKLLYATCSIFPQENDRIVERFLKSEEGAKLLPIDGPWGLKTAVGRQLFPTTDGHDGFYYALLQKTAPAVHNPADLSS